MYRLTKVHEQKVEMEKLMQDMLLKAMHNNVAPRRTGDIPLTDKTPHSYEKQYDSLFFFFSYYESLLILRNP